MSIKSMKIWDTQDTYDGDDGDKLFNFGLALKGKFDGDIAILMGYGGISEAFMADACDKAFNVGYSRIGNTFEEVPTWSWTLHTLAQGVGFTLGSSYTHDCVWGPDGNQAIDCCVGDGW